MIRARSSITAAIVSLALFSAAPAHAALNAYLRILDAKSGQIDGGVTQKGREKKIMVIGTDHNMVVPTDAASGMATGKRQHKPFVIRKEVDKSSPRLYQALATNEALKEWELQFFRPALNGVESVAYTVRLTNARVVSIHHAMANNKDPELMRLAEYEEVAFAYDSITWTWADGGVTATDTWR